MLPGWRVMTVWMRWFPLRFPLSRVGAWATKGWGWFCSGKVGSESVSDDGPVALRVSGSALDRLVRRAVAEAVEGELARKGHRPDNNRLRVVLFEYCSQGGPWRFGA